MVMCMDWPPNREDLMWLGQRILQFEELVRVLAFEPEASPAPQYLTSLGGPGTA